jgi:hypothetical protein
MTVLVSSGCVPDMLRTRRLTHVASIWAAVASRSPSARDERMCGMFCDPGPHYRHGLPSNSSLGPDPLTLEDSVRSWSSLTQISDPRSSVLPINMMNHQLLADAIVLSATVPRSAAADVCRWSSA